MSWVGALVIVIAVYLAANIVVRRWGLFSSSLSPDALRELLARKDVVLVDLRSEPEYRSGHIPGAINIPQEHIASTPPEVSRETVVVLYCRSGPRSTTALRTLKRLGFSNVFDFGALRRWNGVLSKGGTPGVFPSDPASDSDGAARKNEPSSSHGGT